MNALVWFVSGAHAEGTKIEVGQLLSPRQKVALQTLASDGHLTELGARRLAALLAEDNIERAAERNGVVIP